jgi:hypothetical protein
MSALQAHKLVSVGAIFKGLIDPTGAKRRMRSIWKVHPGALLIVACGEGCTYYGAQGGPPWTSWVERWAH